MCVKHVSIITNNCSLRINCLIQYDMENRSHVRDARTRVRECGKNVWHLLATFSCLRQPLFRIAHAPLLLQRAVIGQRSIGLFAKCPRLTAAGPDRCPNASGRYNPSIVRSQRKCVYSCFLFQQCNSLYIILKSDFFT